MQKHRRSRPLQIGVAVLMALVLAQLGVWVGSQRVQIAATVADDAPMVASVGGAPVSQGEVADAPPFETGRDLYHDVSPPLRDIPPVPAETWKVARAMPEPKGEEQVGGKVPPVDVEDPVVQKSFGGSLLSIPVPAVNFEGINNRNGVLPPDTNGDVGPNHYVQMVNLSMQVFNKSGASLFGPVNSNTIWSGFGGPCQTRNDGDPIVLYDPMADRWLLSQFTAANPYGECIAISTSPDPTGSYNRYFFQFSTTTFYDYPHLGVWPDGYYMGANRFTGVTYNGGAAVVFDRTRMLAGLSATFQAFNMSSANGTPFPSDLDGATLPPAGAPNYFMSLGTNLLRLFKFHVDWVTPANSTFTGPTNLGTAAFNVLCPSTRNCVDQPSTTVNLDGIGDRLMYRLAYRNLGTHESLVVNHSVDTIAGTGTQAAVRWYEVRNPNGAATIHQQGTYAPDATQRWMGSVAMDRQGNMAMVYSASSASVFPSIRYTGRLAGDPLGTMPQGEGTLIAGTGSQTHTASRWGDYAMMAVDPVDDCTFWMTTEYIQATGSAPWRTRIGSFKFPGCGGPPPTPTNTATNTPTRTPTNTPTNTPPVGPTNTATNTPTNTPTTVPTNTPTNTPTPASCITTYNSVDVPKAIPDNSTAGVNSNLTISGAAGSITDIDLVNLNATHTWVGDLVITLRHVDTGTVVTLVDRMGMTTSGFGCSADNFSNVALNDGAATLIENVCTTPISGTHRPNNLLSAFNGQSPNGTWTLNVSDRASQDTGTLTGWGVRITTTCP